MTVETTNFYGSISISDESIAIISGLTALDCYGIVDLVANRFKANLINLFKKPAFSKLVKVTNVDNRISIELFVIMKYGVSISAVADSLKKSVKYSVEKFTGMIVDSVSVHVVGVRV